MSSLPGSELHFQAHTRIPIQIHRLGHTETFIRRCLWKSLLVQSLNVKAQLFRIIFPNPSQKLVRVLFRNPFSKQSRIPNPILCLFLTKETNGNAKVIANRNFRVDNSTFIPYSNDIGKIAQMTLTTQSSNAEIRARHAGVKA